MDFGVFDHLDRGNLPLHEHYEARLKLIEYYDRAGFHAYHVAEHHSTPLGTAPSPSVFLAAAAQRTKQLRLGTLVYALPLHHPLRMIEEICMLDHLSNGRLEMGFGRGSSPIELEYFGENPEDSQRDYAETLDAVLRGLQETVLNAQTRAHTFKDVPIELAPLQKPHPPLWYGVHSTDSAERAARLGFNIACNEPAEDSARYISHFWSTWRAAHGERKPLPRVGTTQFVVIADSDEEAQTIARRAYLVWHRSFHHLFRRHGRVARLSGGEADFDALNARGKGIAGTPDTVLRFLTNRLKTAGANYCINRFAFGDLSLAESMRSVDLFVKDVRPALLTTLQ